MTDNSWLMQFLSNILDISVEVPKITETTALGVAMMAALTDGKYSTLEELSNLWSSNKSYIPKIDKSERDNLLKNWDYYVNKTLDVIFRILQLRVLDLKHLLSSNYS